MSEIKLFNRWTVKKKSFWIAVAAIIAIPLAFLLVVSFIFFSGPARLSASVYDQDYNSYDYAEESMPMAAPGIDGDYYGDDEIAGKIVLVESESLSSNQKQFDQTASSVYQSDPSDRIIIKEGNISIEVEDTRESREAIYNIVSSLKNQGAFVINSFETQNYEGAAPYISMSIRIPFEEFEHVMEAIANMGIEINQRNEFSDDVTAEYVDLAARIESMDAARERLLEIMLDADTTEDLLYAEQKLTERETEMESLKGRLKYLSESALLSRISISLTPHTSSQPIDYSWKPANTLRNAFDSLVNSLENFADFLIVFAVLFLPWILLFTFIIWLVSRFFKRRAAKKILKKKNEEK